MDGAVSTMLSGDFIKIFFNKLLTKTMLPAIIIGERDVSPISFQKELIYVNNIRSETTYPLANIKNRLRKKVDEVLNLLGETDSEIHWIITDKYSLHHGFYGLFRRGSPAWAFPNQKEIYIDICILWRLSLPTSTLYDFMNVRFHNDFLANVIMDELAHIKTGKDHGSKEYDEKLTSYVDRYYNRKYCDLLPISSMKKLYRIYQNK